MSRAVSKLSHSFRAATGWPLKYTSAAQAGRHADPLWSAPVDPGVGGTPGHLTIGPAPAAEPGSLARKVSLAEALLRRKELNQKVAQLDRIKTDGLFEVKVQRKPAHEGIDDVIAQVPKVSIAEVTSAYDWHARRLRLVDLAIQQANHATTVEVADDVMGDYKPTENG